MIIEIITVSIIAFVINIPLGRVRTRYKKLSLPWWLLIHASIPVVVALRLFLSTPQLCIPLFIAIAVFGQFVGAKSVKRNSADSFD